MKCAFAGEHSVGGPADTAPAGLAARRALHALLLVDVHGAVGAPE